jgi:hypothetical protein
LVDRLIVFIFRKGENVVDIVDERNNGNCFYGYASLLIASEVFAVFLNQEIFIVEQETIEFTEILLFRHLIFYYKVEQPINNCNEQ